jgi:iron complex transport system ATP-binding protein
LRRAFDIQNVSYAYRTRTILRDLSFGIASGAFFAIIGPNGAGKTTLLRLLAGIDKPASGSIQVRGKPVGVYPRKALARRLALVPQLTQVDFPFTVREIVQMGRTPHLGLLGLPSAQDRHVVDQSMRFAGIDHLPKRHLSQLSGGECQRVLLARAICQAPDIILLDEPTAALDLAHKIRMMDLMEQLRQERQMTVVMVSHDINLAALYADTMLLLKDGQNVAIGPPAEILTTTSIKTAYGCDVVIDLNPLGEGIPRVAPIPGKYLSAKKPLTNP